MQNLYNKLDLGKFNYIQSLECEYEYVEEVEHFLSRHMSSSHVTSSHTRLLQRKKVLSREKSWIVTGMVWDVNMAANMAAVGSCENTLYQ